MGSTPKAKYSKILSFDKQRKAWWNETSTVKPVDSSHQLSHSCRCFACLGIIFKMCKGIAAYCSASLSLAVLAPVNVNVNVKRQMYLEPFRYGSPDGYNEQLPRTVVHLLSTCCPLVVHLLPTCCPLVVHLLSTCCPLVNLRPCRFVLETLLHFEEHLPSLTEFGIQHSTAFGYDFGILWP